MIFQLHFSAYIKETFIFTQIQIEAHVMNDLKINLLLNIDNIIFKKIIINLANRQTIFNLCDNAVVKLNIIFKLNY